MRKHCSSDREKLLKFQAEGREFAKFLRYLISNKSEQLEFKLEKIIGIQKHAGKVRKYILPANYSKSIWKFSHSITKRHLFRLARVSTSFGLSKLVVRPGLVR